jgi:hypothetical protein
MQYVLLIYHETETGAPEGESLSAKATGSSSWSFGRRSH